MASGAAFGQERTIERSTIWVDAVKRGDMPVRVRGAGVLTSNTAAESNIPESLAKNVPAGQTVSLDTRCAD